MSRFVNAVIVGLASFIVLLSVFWYAVEVSREGQISVRVTDIAWGPVDERGTEIFSQLLVHNPHRLDVQMTRVEYRLLLNGEQLDLDTREPNLRVLALADATLNVTSRFPTSFVPNWINVHARESEETKLLIRGEAAFLLAQELVTIPFETSTTTETQLADSIASAYQNCAPQTRSICLDSANARLVSSAAGAQVQIDFHLENPNATTLRVTNWTTVLELNDVQVADGRTDNPIQLLPHSGQEGRITLAFDPAQLTLWWPRHTADCERSSLLLAVTFTLEERRQGGGNSTSPNSTGNGSSPPAAEETVVYDVVWRLPGSSFRTSIACPKV